MLTREFIEQQAVRLEVRKRSKEQILKSGGQQALSHSYRDITRILFALKRIENGQYGICTNCGVSIGGKRLKAIPETPFCLKCAS